MSLWIFAVLGILLQGSYVFKSRHQKRNLSILCLYSSYDIRNQTIDLMNILLNESVWNTDDLLHAEETLIMSEKVSETTTVFVFNVSLILKDSQNATTSDYISAQSTEFIGMNKLTLNIGNLLIRIVSIHEQTITKDSDLVEWCRYVIILKYITYIFHF